MSNDNRSVVENFLGSWAKGKERMFETFPQHLAPDVVWENVGLNRVAGIDEVIKCFKSMIQHEPVFDYVGVEIDYYNVMENAGTVIVERLDRMVDDAGNTIKDFKAIGVFEVKDGLISEWRDYFDTAPFRNWAVSAGYLHPA